MDSERWKQISSILDSVMDLPSPEREHAARAATGDDADLQREVLGYLAADSSRGALDRTLSDVVDVLIPADGEPAVPDTIGPFRVLRRLGVGGMGVVYEAEQDVPFRRVALKVLRGTHDDDATRLFRREIASLVRLQHPAIAIIYEAGQSAEGGPYFAQELVSGRSLAAEIADEGPPTDRASLTSRLDLFLNIVDAIAFAHQRAVLHRDLKPTNVMVVDPPDDGSESAGISAVKVLDFGLSRIDDDPLKQDVDLTEVGRIRGTLSYMSPEQAVGDNAAVDARTDIYSLGMILYQMLTGERPYDIGGKRLDLALNTIATASPGAIKNPAIDQDLATIVFKALAKDPDDRYSSAEAFAADLRRFLNDEPILARPPQLSYRIRKWAQRNRGVSIASALAIVTLVGFSITMTHMFRVQREERARAEVSAEKSEAISHFLQAFIRNASPFHGPAPDITLRDALHVASDELNANPPSVPIIGALIHSDLAESFMAVGLTDAGVPHARRAYAILDSLGADPSVSTADRIRIIRTMSMSYAGISDVDEARTYIERCLLLARNASPVDSTALAQAMYDLAVNRHEHAATYLDTSITYFKGHLPEYISWYASALVLRSRYDMFSGTGDPLGRLTEALDASERANHRGSVEYLDALVTLGHYLIRQRNYEGATNRFEEAVALGDEFGSGHLLLRLSAAHMGLSKCHMVADRLGEARASVDEALAIMEHFRGPLCPSSVIHHERYAELSFREGDFDAAQTHLDVAEGIREEHNLPKNNLYNTRGKYYEEMGNLSAAEEQFALAIEEARVVFGQTSRTTRAGWLSLAEFHQRQGSQALADSFGVLARTGSPPKARTE